MTLAEHPKWAHMEPRSCIWPKGEDGLCAYHRTQFGITDDMEPEQPIPHGLRDPETCLAGCGDKKQKGSPLCKNHTTIFRKEMLWRGSTGKPVSTILEWVDEVAEKVPPVRQDSGEGEG